ncbi:MAG: ribonuclease P protein component [Bdellovibrio sp.]|nr:ribonuclease P protein component [Bdellovibrio sp.]
MNYTFPKELRVRNKDEFFEIRKSGKIRVFGELFVIMLAGDSDTGSGLKLGISVPKHYGNAVHRNRFKRIVREIVRQDNVLKSLPYKMIIGPNLRTHTVKWPYLVDFKRSFHLLKCGLVGH